MRPVDGFGQMLLVQLEQSIAELVLSILLLKLCDACFELSLANVRSCACLLQRLECPAKRIICDPTLLRL